MEDESENDIVLRGPKRTTPNRTISSTALIDTSSSSDEYVLQ